MDGAPRTERTKADFEALYEREYLRLKRTLIGVLRDESAAEDCVQEAFVKAYRAWSTWRGDAPAGLWLQRIAINTALSYRRRQRLGDLKQRLAGAPPDPPGSDAGVAGWDLAKCLRNLSPKQAAAVILRHYHGYAMKEMAGTLGVSERAAAFRLSRALGALRHCLDEHAPSPAPVVVDPVLDA